MRHIWKMHCKTAPTDQPYTLLVAKEVTWAATASAVSDQLFANYAKMNGIDEEPREFGASSQRNEMSAATINAWLSRYEQSVREPPSQGTSIAAPAAGGGIDGTCKEFACSLALALRRIGHDAVLGFSSRRTRNLDESVPCPYVLDHVQVVLRDGRSGHVIDPFSGRWCETILCRDEETKSTFATGLRGEIVVCADTRITGESNAKIH